MKIIKRDSTKKWNENEEVVDENISKVEGNLKVQRLNKELYISIFRFYHYLVGDDYKINTGKDPGLLNYGREEH
jgi:hypothetical protein